MPNGRCRMHGGIGNKNALKDGGYTAEAIALRREISGLTHAKSLQPVSKRLASGEKIALHGVDLLISIDPLPPPRCSAFLYGENPQRRVWKKTVGHAARRLASAAATPI